MKKYIYFVLLLILSAVNTNAQSLVLFDLDASNFPTIRAKFYVYDKDGYQITGFSNSDFKISENGKLRTVTQVSCPVISPAAAVSSVLVMDASGSMGGLNIGLAKIGAASYINGIRNNLSETAISVFDDGNYLISPFITDRQKLLKAVDEIYYNKYGFTDYNAALLMPLAGGLVLTRSAKYKKIIVFLSDGKPTTTPNTAQIIETALQQEVKIYSVAIGMGIEKNMQEIAIKTGGKWFHNIKTEQQAKDIYKQILEESQGEDAYCTIEWQSEVTCTPVNTLVTVDEMKYGTTTNLSYQSNPNSVARLDIKPSSIKFDNAAPGKVRDTTINITATNAKFTVSNIISSNNAFSITPKSFVLNPGETKALTVSFLPVDSSYTYGDFDVVTDLCPGKIFVSGGFPGKSPPKPSLKLTHPNGGEIFVAGSDTVITWTGIIPSDTVVLDYSYDKGKNWNIITNDAFGLKYNWKNIPKPASDSCLVRVTQKSTAGFADKVYTGGGKYYDKGFRTAADNAGNVYVTGTFQNTLTFDNSTLSVSGFSQYFVVKYNSAGNVVWVRSGGNGYSNDISSDIDLDSKGNVYITGNIRVGRTTVAFISKYDQNGTLLWTKTTSSISSTYAVATGITVDYNGNATITGYFGGAAVFGILSEITSKGNEDIFVARYNTNGDLIWVTSAGGTGVDIARDISCDAMGNLYVTGDFTLSATFGNQTLKSQGEEDIFYLKYDEFSNLQFAYSAGSTGSDKSYSISAKSYESAVFAGSFKGIASFGSQALTSRDTDYFVAKIDKYGNVLWARSGGSETSDGAFGVASDTYGNIAVTGYFTGTAGFGSQTMVSKGGRDIFVSRYDETGNFVWARSAESLSDITGFGIDFDNNGNVVVTGEYQGVTDFGINQVTSRGGYDMFLWKIKFDILQSDISDSLFSIVAPNPTTQNVDMKQVLVGSSKDSVVQAYIRNPGTYKFRVDSIYFRGADAGSFEIVSGLPVYEILPNESMFAEFRFKPQRVGLHNAEIVINTQSDVLVQTIRGEGVQPQIEVVNKIIDFGIVQVGDYKDTVQAVTVKNIGNATLYITETKHGLPNAVDFTTLSGAGPFSLLPGQVAKMDLRFNAASEGVTGGTLEFHYSGAGSPAIVQLYGEGLDLSPKIISNYEPVKDLICDYSSAGKLELSNTGINPLIISDIEITGNDAASFTLSKSAPISIEKDSTFIIDVMFVPKSIGLKTAEIKIISNSAINPELLVPLSAFKDSVAVISQVRSFNLGFLCPGEKQDTMLTLENAGTIRAGAYLTASSGIILNSDEAVLNSGEELSVNFAFIGSTVEGAFSENITIIDSICGYTYTVNVTGTVTIPKFNAPDITIRTFTGQPKFGIITLYNTGLTDLFILNEPVLAAPFEFVAGQLPIKVPALDSIKISVKFTPPSIGELQTSIKFNIEPCARELTVNIFTITEAAGAFIEIPDVSAYAGDIIEIPIILKNAANLIESGVTGFDLVIKYNPTLLAPLDYPATIIDDRNARINMVILKPLETGQIAKIKFKAGLGNAESCPVVISDARSLGYGASVITQNGSFTLLGICRDGGTRLVNPTGTAGIVSISPNPSDIDLKVSLNLIEKGFTTLTVYNSTGISCSQFRFTGESGMHSLNIDITGLSSGIYYIHLQTPTVSDIRPFIIVK